MSHLIAQCMVCNDKKHFKMKVQTVKNINHRMMERLYGLKESNLCFRDLTEDYKIIYNKIRNDNQHQHFMCGRCFKINEIELSKEEDKLHYLVIGIIKAYRDDKISSTVVYDIKRLLQGNYIRCCRELINTLEMKKERI